jgi:vancomycin permeability regulator SanA
MKIFNKTILSLITIIVLVIISYGIYITFYPVTYDVSNSHDIGVVFGAGITRSGDPSPALKFRLEKSVSLFEDQKIKRIFVSGRNAEAIVMKNYLLKKGIPQNDIIADIYGETTFVTVKNARQFIINNGLADGAVFISQKYHIPRIIFIVHKLGIRDAEFIAASPNKVNVIEGSFIVTRETLAWLKNLFLD